MKLSSKLILSFSFVALLLVAIGVSSQYYNQEIKNQVVEESGEAVMELQYSGEMGLKLYSSLLSAQYFLDKRYNQSILIDTANFELSAESAKEKIYASLDDFSTNLDSYRKMLERHDKYDMEKLSSRRNLIAVLNKVEDRYGIYTSLIEQVFRLSSANYEDGREFLNVTVEPYFRRNMIPLIEEMRTITQANLDREIEILNARLEYAGTLLAVATVLALLISIGVAVYLYRSIATPLKVLEDTAKQIGAGNLDQRIEVTSEDEIGNLASEFNRMAENLSKTTFSKDYVDNIIESMADALVVTDEQCRIKKINSSARAMLGYSESEILDKPLDLLFANGEASEIELYKSENRLENYETKYLTKHGEMIPVNFSRALMRNADGSVKGFVCVASDITERKQAEHQVKKSLKEKEILLAEIHHRVKNNLAVISGLLQMQIWETDNQAAESSLRDSQLRVQSIALVHEKLYQSENLSFIEFDKYLRDLLNAIGSTYMDNAGNTEIKTDLDPIGLNINQAIPCSLLINELVVNAYKHAFENRDDGVICINMHQEDNTILLKVKDNGSGFPEGFSYKSSKSLGMSIVNTLVEQLGAKLDNYNEDGAVFELTFEQEEVV